MLHDQLVRFSNADRTHVSGRFSKKISEARFEPTDSACREPKMDELKAEARTIFKKPPREAGGNHRRDDKQPQWMRTVMKSGTLADRIAYLTLAVKNSPRTGMGSLDSLLSMLKKKSRRESLMALDALSALYKDQLLPSDRKLTAFEKHTISELTGVSKPQREEMLAEWFQEDCIKSRYNDFVTELEGLLKDQVTTTRLKILGIVFDLLTAKPEKEERLLSMMVNKLGDPDKTVASKVCIFLVRLLRQHPNMKSVVVEEVERLMFRPNISPKAQYYATCFLIQIRLGDKEPALAVKLVKIYFALFKSITAKKSANPKMMSAILTGVNRSYPFTKGPQNLIEHIDTFFRYVHTVSGQVGIQILMLLYQVMEREGAITDRFYMALYRKMLDPELLAHSLRSSSLLNLLYKAMKRDTEIKRIRAFVKRMLQLALTHAPAFACGTLIVVAEVIKSKPKGFHTKLFQTFKAEDAKEAAQGESGKRLCGYSVMDRNPLYCGAECVELYELQILRRHFHPSVARFADCIIQNKPLDYAGDPFEDFTSMHFLDRFVYRNPKKKGGDTDNITAKNLSVLSDQYLSLPEKAIPDDERFLHRYLKERLKQKKAGIGHEDIDVESVADEEFDQFLDDFERTQGDVDMDLDFAGDVGEGAEERELLDDDASLFGDDDEGSEDGKEFSAADEDALNAAFASDDEHDEELDDGDADNHDDFSDEMDYD